MFFFCFIWDEGAYPICSGGHVEPTAGLLDANHAYQPSKLSSAQYVDGTSALDLLFQYNFPCVHDPLSPMTLAVKWGRETRNKTTWKVLHMMGNEQGSEPACLGLIPSAMPSPPGSLTKGTNGFFIPLYKKMQKQEGMSGS